MMFQKWVLLAAAALAAPAMAEELHYNVAEFSESASVRVPNDTMSVTLRVVESGASREAVSNKVTKRVNAVLARAKANRAFEVESGSRSVYPEYDEKRKGIKGWTDSADIYVKSADFAALSKLVADSQQDAMLGGVSFSVSPKKHAAAVDAGDGIGALMLAAALRDPHPHPGRGWQHGGAGAQQARAVDGQLCVGRQLAHPGHRELVLRRPQCLEHCALESPPTTCHERVRLSVV